MRFINGGTPTPRHIIQHDILPGFLHYTKQYPAYNFWATIEKTSSDFLGWFSFRPVTETPYDISLGYRLHQTTWGQGFATEGARALIDQGFTKLNVQRIIATTYQDNLASRRVMEKLGMTLVRRFRIMPHDLLQSDTSHVAPLDIWDSDDLEYALTRAEWEQ